MTYTVVAVYQDSGQVHVAQVITSNAASAARRAKDNAEAPICVLCVFEGEHTDLYTDLYGHNELMEVF